MMPRWYARSRVRRAVFLVLLAACGAHHHGPNRADDPSHLYVEVYADGSHGGALRDGAHEGLAGIGFVVPTTHNGDVELSVEVSHLDDAGRGKACGVKILVLRLPQHDLLGIADASGRGPHADACLGGVTTTLVRSRVRGLLQRRLRDKR